MHAVFTYWQTEGGLTHLSHPGVPSSYTLCGRSTASMTLGDETLSGIGSDCASCRRQSPAGPMPDAPEPFAERRARYRSAVLHWTAQVLRSHPGHPKAPDPADFGLTEQQGADAREALALVLDHRAETGGRVRI